MSSIPDLIVYIRQYVDLQVKLLKAFRVEFPYVSDWEYLLDAPKTGEVVIDCDKFVFQRHGGGLAFNRGDGLIIDAHKYLSIPGAIDAWRLLQYLESNSIVEKGSVSVQKMEELLGALKDKGELFPLQHDGHYRLTG